ncbi:MAG: PP2C family serine/threonine-protein phosphatase, partial [Myxococcota bacterium]
NEDAFLAIQELGLFVVADGMGGHVGGQMASALAVKTVQESVERAAADFQTGAGVDSIEESPVPRMLADSVRAACGAIYQAAQDEPELQGMGTTVTGVAFVDTFAFFGHVGDSRAYLIRDGRIEQLSEDHSLVNEQLKAGLITPEQARMSRFKHIITRSVGFEEDVAVDTMVVPTQEGDLYVLCSDGLANLVSNQEIRDVLMNNFLRDAPKAMVALANERGGDDNITVVVLYVNGEE